MLPTPAGGWIPVDPDPDDGGNVVLDPFNRGVVIGPESETDEERFMPHFNTCRPYIESRRPGQERLDLE